MSNLDIIVTGLGVWTAAGTTPEELWRTAASGLSTARFRSIEGILCIACAAPDPGPCTTFPQAHRMDRSTRLALAAAVPAFQAARLADLAPERIAVLVGNSRGPAGLWHAASPTVSRIRPTQSAHTAVASLSGALSLALHARGPCLTISATCASAAHAIAIGAGLLLSGAADAVVAGGAEAPLIQPLLDQFLAAGLLGSHPDPALACRPFDATRNGMVPGEGAAFLVLERADGARPHGRPPALARLAGSAMTAESHNRVAARPDGDGLARAVAIAIAQARIDPAAVVHVNAHGTGTRINDAAEAAALHQVFGAQLPGVAVTSTKPVTGHGFGAAPAIEAVLTILALQHQLVPPTAGFSEADPALGLIPVTGSPRPIQGRYALSTSLGFWGNAAALIFELPPDGSPGRVISSE